MIFEPIDVGKLEIKNRIAKSATYEHMASLGGRVTERLVNLYEDLAAGETGLIITGHCYVEPSGRAAPRQTGVDSDSKIPGLARIAAAVRARGAKSVLQIAHAGMQTYPLMAPGGPIAPSKASFEMYLFKARPMTAADMSRVETAFAAAARRAVTAGFDGVQLHGAHGYLLSQFLSPVVNRRTDEYGGPLVNRLRFPLRVIRAVRAAVGPSYPILYKLNAADHINGGLEADQAAEAARALEKAGVDVIEISSGWGSSGMFVMARGGVPVDELIGSRRIAGHLERRLFPDKSRFQFSELYNLPLAERVREAVSIPLMMVGGIRSRDRMEEVLSSGSVDILALARPLISEHDLPRRMRLGKVHRARCVNCNRCIMRVARGRPLACALG